MRRGGVLSLLMVMLAWSPASRAADEAGLGGLLLNETRTFAGQAFFAGFTETWRALDPEGRLSLVVSERPSARSGSQISVRYGQTLLLQQFIHFNAERARKAGRAAAGPVFDRVAGAEVEELFANPDLAPDEAYLK